MKINFYFDSDFFGKKSKFVVCILLFILILCSCKKEKESLVIFHAGSLTVPMKHLAEEFSKLFPELNIYCEAAGSRACARKIIDLKKKADVFASADSEVIRTLMYPDYADFCIDFAVNEMVIVYTKDSPYAGEINASNWPDILMKKGVEYGHSDPNADPCGYRTLLCWQLAEIDMNRPGLYDQLSANRPLKNIRPKEVDLLALLEAGELDYIFIYRSIAEQYKKKFLILPDRINLKSDKYKSFYKNAAVEINGKSPGETIVRFGAPIIYGITIPKTARSPHWGEMFIDFILNPEGQNILKTNHYVSIISPKVDNRDNLPLGLKKVLFISDEN